MSSITSKIDDLIKWQQEQERRLSALYFETNGSRKEVTVDNERISSDSDSSIEEINCAGNSSPVDSQLNNLVEERIEAALKSVRSNEKELNSQYNLDELEPEVIRAVLHDQSIKPKFSLENSPVQPGIDGKSIKTFEELVESRIKPTPDPNQVESSNSAKKRPFLKKGAGLVRFNNFSPANQLDTTKAVLTKSASQYDIPSSTNYKKHTENFDVTKPLHRKVVRVNGCQNDTNLNRCTQMKSKFTSFHDQSLKLRTTVRKNPCTNFKSRNFSSSNSNLSEESKDDDDNKDDEDDEDDEDDDESDSVYQGLEQLLSMISLRKIALKNEAKKQTFNSDRVPSKETKKRELVEKRATSRLLRTTDPDLKSLYRHPQSLETLISPYTKALKEEIAVLEKKLESLKKTQTSLTLNHTKSTTSLDLQKFESKNDFDELRKQITSLEKKVENLEREHLTAEKPSNPPCTKENGTKENGLHVSNVFTMKPPLRLKTAKVSVSNNQRQNTTRSASASALSQETSKSAKKTEEEDNLVVDYIASDGVKQTVFADGSRVIEFPSGQVERINKCGIKHVYYPNSKMERTINPNGSEEILTSDGIRIRISREGDEIIELPNGEREIRTSEYKRREYRDGTVKTVYNDGIQETRYYNGRLRIKNSNGDVLFDSASTDSPYKRITHKSKK